MFRYKILHNFPREIVEYVTQIFETRIKNKEKDLNTEVVSIQEKLKIILIETDEFNINFYSKVSFLISDPLMGRASIHTDKSRKFCINIPIQINHEKSDYICGKYQTFSHYKNPKKHLLSDKIGYTFSYDKEDFELVKITHPIFINTAIPHAWTNYDDQYRIVASLAFKTQNMHEAENISAQWE